MLSLNSAGSILSRAAGAFKKQSCELFLAEGTKYHQRLLQVKIFSTKQKALKLRSSAFLNSGNYLLSRAVTHQVSSAWRSLTTVFGMGTGVTSLLSSPNGVEIRSLRDLLLFAKLRSFKRFLLFPKKFDFVSFSGALYLFCWAFVCLINWLRRIFRFVCSACLLHIFFISLEVKPSTY